jgi:hypothetical protein
MAGINQKSFREPRCFCIPFISRVNQAVDCESNQSTRPCVLSIKDWTALEEGVDSTPVTCDRGTFKVTPTQIFPNINLSGTIAPVCTILRSDVHQKSSEVYSPKISTTCQLAVSHL